MIRFVTLLLVLWSSLALAAPTGEYNRTNLDRAEWDKFETTGEVRTTVADQTTPTIILPMVEFKQATTLASPTTLFGYDVTLTDPTGFTAGQCLRIIDPTINKFYCSRIVSILGSVATLDTQIDDVYSAGSQVITGNGNMAVDGSVTPVIFKLRLGSPSTQQIVDITRIIIQCTASSAVDLNKFGDLPALTRGVSMRRVNGDVVNIFNVKSNLDITGLAYDFTVYTASNPAQAVNGFASRLTFAGQNKLGVALRVTPDGNLEILVQDDLTGLIQLRIVAEGHVVQ